MIEVGRPIDKIKHHQRTAASVLHLGVHVRGPYGLIYGTRYGRWHDAWLRQRRSNGSC